MAYASVDDLAEYITTANVNEYEHKEGAGSAQGALDEASDLVDSYLARFDLPLALPYPGALVRANKIVAGYDVMVSLGFVREGDESEWRLRYLDVIKWLEQVAKGLVTPPGMEEPVPPADPSSGVGMFVRSDKPRGW